MNLYQSLYDKIDRQIPKYPIGHEYHYDHIFDKNKKIFLNDELKDI